MVFYLIGNIGTDWLLKLILSTFAELIKITIIQADFIINNIFTLTYAMNNLVALQTVFDYTRDISIALVSLYVIKQGIDIYMLQIEGDPDADPLEMVTRVSVTVATIMCSQWVIDFLIDVSRDFTNEMTRFVLPNTTSISESIVNYLNTNAMAMTGAAIFQVLIGIAIGICNWLFLFKAAKRGTELMLFKVVVPIFAIDNLNTSRERWNNIKNELLVCMFGYSIQVLCYFIFIFLWAGIMDPVVGINLIYLFACFGWMGFVMSAPVWLKKFVYSSGVGNATKGGARSVAYILPSILRAAK